MQHRKRDDETANIAGRHPPTYISAHTQSSHACLHHFAFDADSRADVDQLHALLVSIGAKILDPPGEYYGKHYYAVFFADPDGLKLEFVHLSQR